MKIESTKPIRVSDEWEIAAVTHTKTHTTLHPIPLQGPNGPVQQPGVQLEGVLHFEVGARCRFTVEEIPPAAAVAKVPPSVQRKLDRKAARLGGLPQEPTS